MIRSQRLPERDHVARNEPCKVILGGRECSVFRGVWSAPTETVQRILQIEEDRVRETGLRPPEPDADYASAVYMAKRFGGTVISKPEPDSVPDRVY